MWLTRHKTLVMAIGIGLGAILLLLVAVMPIYKNATRLVGVVKTKSDNLNSLTTKVSILSKLDPEVLKDRVNTLDAALPPKKDILLYLNSIDGLSRELGLSFGGLSLSPGDITEATGSAKKSAKVAGLQSLETQIRMSGGQASIYTFLRTIEGVLPLMQIKDIKVSVLGPDQYGLELTLGMLWADPGTVDVKGPVTLFGAEEDKYFAQLSSYRRFDTAVEFPPVTGGKTDLFAPVPSETPIPGVATPKPSPSVKPLQ